MPTFAELFCARDGIAPERYARAIFWRCLHRRGLFIAPVILLLNAEFFGPDFELINRIGRLKNLVDLNDELADFCMDLSNRSVIRRLLKVRLSATRVSHLVRHTFSGAGNHPQAA